MNLSWNKQVSLSKSGQASSKSSKFTSIILSDYSIFIPQLFYSPSFTFFSVTKYFWYIILSKSSLAYIINQETSRKDSQLKSILALVDKLLLPALYFAPQLLIFQKLIRERKSRTFAFLQVSSLFSRHLYFQVNGMRSSAYIIKLLFTYYILMIPVKIR